MIPLVVLPSVWLTIMLRFSSRTPDDYKAFCSFMELRTNESTDDIDIFTLLEKLAAKTDSRELKERIVKEIYENKEQYNSIDEYDNKIQTAFDLVLDEKDEEQRKQVLSMQSELAHKKRKRMRL